MAIGLKEKRLGTIVLIVVIGILIGSYLNSLMRVVIPGENNVVKNFFTTNVYFGIGDFGIKNAMVLGVEGLGKNNTQPDLRPLVIDLNAIKFQLGFQMKFSLLSILGIFISLYFFRWYK
ncbi:MAG: DUF4321 domain-containing protein [Chitinivibrionales bacterium]|nr:DUF4321 domain-containing protein [Chitinivibrionales bacterium]